MRAYAGELLTALCALVGWLLLTFAASMLVGWLAWPVSGGLLALSLVGWRMLGVIIWRGLYDLTSDPEGDEEE